MWFCSSLVRLNSHPWNAQAYADRLEELSALIDQSPLLGEIGLDFHWVEDSACYPVQRQVFEFFLAAARRQDKVVTLHTKGAEAEVLEWLDRYQLERAIVHWYSGPLDVFREMVERNYHFTIIGRFRLTPFQPPVAPNRVLT